MAEHRRISRQSVEVAIAQVIETVVEAEYPAASESLARPSIASQQCIVSSRLFCLAMGSRLQSQLFTQQYLPACCMQVPKSPCSTGALQVLQTPQLLAATTAQLLALMKACVPAG